MGPLSSLNWAGERVYKRLLLCISLTSGPGHVLLLTNYCAPNRSPIVCRPLRTIASHELSHDRLGNTTFAQTALAICTPLLQPLIIGSDVLDSMKQLGITGWDESSVCFIYSTSRVQSDICNAAILPQPHILPHQFPENVCGI